MVLRKSKADESLTTIRLATDKINELKIQKQELLLALDAANTRLLTVRLQMEKFLEGGLDCDLVTHSNLDSVKGSYEASKRVLLKYLNSQ